MILKKVIRNLLPRQVTDVLWTLSFYYRTSPLATRLGVGSVPPVWQARINDCVACNDNHDIPRHPDAGKISGKWITMHNGVVVSAMGYYDSNIMNLLIRNKGVHEPQEEKAFEIITPYLSKNGTMLELGAYWAFYSLSFKRGSKDRICFMVEPKLQNLLCGKINFRKNGCTGDFTRAYVGASPTVTTDGIPVISVDDFCKRKSIKKLDILHADIQSFELDMLHGAEGMFSHNAITYCFVSTHSEELHRKCVSFLNEKGLTIVCEASPAQSYSEDGVIVAKLKDAAGPDHIEISKKNH